MCADAIPTAAAEQLTADEMNLLMQIDAVMSTAPEVALIAAYQHCAEIAEGLGEHKTAAAIRALLDIP